jgi:hypothetical protein
MTTVYVLFGVYPTYAECRTFIDRLPDNDEGKHKLWCRSAMVQ